MDDLDIIPIRVKHYLLDWKDRNMDHYIEKYGELKLHQLNIDQLFGLFVYATRQDMQKFKKKRLTINSIKNILRI